LQELQRVHKQELSSSRAAQARLRMQADQQAAELAAAQAQLVAVNKQHSAASREAEQLKAELRHVQDHNQRLVQQLQQVSL
jgi:chromosome segregation ATPase